MIITYSRVFKKTFRKHPAVIQERFYEKIALLLKNQHNPLLANHALHGAWAGCRSINITGDIRAIFEEVDKKHIDFVEIGSHSELYS